MKLSDMTILQTMSQDKRSLAVLIDPDKVDIVKLSSVIVKVNQSIATHIFVGGSTVDDDLTETVVAKIKTHTSLPVVLFPGDITQITNHADALLFLSLISGNNADYLIGKHRKAVSKLRGSHLEVIPTGYILIENGRQTSVEIVTQTQPLSRDRCQSIVDTAKAGELLGMKLMYLEAGSGALDPVPIEIIKLVKQELSIPIIVGGGIRSKGQVLAAYEAGADVVVIGTAFETDDTFLEAIKVKE